MAFMSGFSCRFTDSVELSLSQPFTVKKTQHLQEVFILALGKKMFKIHKTQY